MGTNDLNMKKTNFSTMLNFGLLGGLDMSWLKVIVMAVLSAVITAVFLIVPVFKNTSFERMGVYMEAWLFLTVVIMTNCEKPLEAACKVLVFFLISQPLIYLLQVPFSSLGWMIFGYYPFWFKLTLATFPLAYAGWHVKKKNWMSVVMIGAASLFLAFTAAEVIKDMTGVFPRYLLTVLFCLGQIILYAFAFMPNKLWQYLCIGLPLAAMIVVMILKPQVNLELYEQLPEGLTFSKEAVVEVSDPSIAEVDIRGPQGEILRVLGHKYGVTEVTVRDGNKTVRFSIEVYRDDNKYDQIKVVIKD